jgi:hypothetical protein
MMRRVDMPNASARRHVCRNKQGLRLTRRRVQGGNRCMGGSDVRRIMQQARCTSGAMRILCVTCLRWTSHVYMLGLGRRQCFETSMRHQMMIVTRVHKPSGNSDVSLLYCPYPHHAPHVPRAKPAASSWAFKTRYVLINLSQRYLIGRMRKQPNDHASLRQPCGSSREAHMVRTAT